MERAPSVGAICVERGSDAADDRRPNTRWFWINRRRALLANEPRSD